MRLDPKELEAVMKATEGVDGEVYLFGSRVNPKGRGGDIDLLVFSDKKPFHLSREISVRFFMECEEKIDVVVMNPLQLTKHQKAFLNSISRERIR
jgi:predicted nucleotidyltransferase